MTRTSLDPAKGAGRPPSGFSLVEIVLALGIVAFAIVGIMGLFPVALRSAKEAERETRVTLIARQIFNDLRSAPADNTFVVTNANFLANQRTLNLSAASVETVSYTAEGRPVGSGDEAFYLATVQVTPNTPIAGLSRVQTTVEAPVAATATNRSSYTFVTLMRQ